MEVTYLGIQVIWNWENGPILDTVTEIKVFQAFRQFWHLCIHVFTYNAIDVHFWIQFFN